MKNAVLVPAVLLLLTALAGCTGESGAQVAPEDIVNPDLSPEEREKELANLKITKDSVVEAPAWAKGEYWSVDVFFGDEFSPGVPISFDAVVYDDQGDQYKVGSSTRPAAVFESIIDIPFLGHYAKKDLATTDGGEPFQFYQWPLFHDKTWQSQTAFDFGGTQTYTFHVAFKADISTPRGKLPGFQVHGLNETNVVLFEWDYIPALHWFTHAYFYNREDPKKFDIHIMVGGHGFNYKGNVMVLNAEPVLQKEWFLFINPFSPTDSAIPTEPGAATFDISKDYTSIAGFVFSFAFAGADETMIVSPEGTRYEVRALDPALAGAFQFSLLLDAPSEKGTWKFVTAGLGVGAGGGAFLWGVQDTVHEL